MVSSVPRSGPLQPCGVTSPPVLRGALPGPQTLIHGAGVPPIDPSQCLHPEKHSRGQDVTCKQTRHPGLGAQSRRCGLTPGHVRGLELAPLCHCGSGVQCGDECASLCLQPGREGEGWRTNAERPSRCLRPASRYQGSWSLPPWSAARSSFVPARHLLRHSRLWQSWLAKGTDGAGRPVCHRHSPQPLPSLQTSVSSLGNPVGRFAVVSFHVGSDRHMASAHS